MTIKNSVLMLAIATALSAGTISLNANADEPLASAKVATTAPMPSDNDAAERAERAAEDAKEAAEDANEAADEAHEEAEEHHGLAPASRMSKAQIIASLTAAGFTDFDDVDLDDGIWEVEATDPYGAEVKLKVDPVDGHIISSEKD